MKNPTFNTEKQAANAAKKAGWSEGEFTTRKGPNDKWIYEVIVTGTDETGTESEIEFTAAPALDEALSEGGEEIVEQDVTEETLRLMQGDEDEETERQMQVLVTGEPAQVPESISDDTPVDGGTEQGNDLSEDELEALRARKQELTAELGEINAKLATQQTVTQFRSAVGSPVQLCREVYIEHLHAAGEDPEKVVRKDVIGKLTGMGVAPNTAKTQYQILRTKAIAGELLEDTEETDDE